MKVSRPASVPPLPDIHPRRPDMTVVARRSFRRVAMAVAVSVLLASCAAERSGTPAPALHLGTRTDSIGGAAMVEPGDNLWTLSKRYRLPLRDIIALNGMSPPYTLRPGNRVLLPVPLEHRTGPEDTLYGLARMYGVPVSQLVKVNRLQKPYLLKVGQMVRIPSSVRPSAVAPKGQAETRPSVVARPLPRTRHPDQPPKNARNRVVSSALLPPPRSTEKTSALTTAAYAPRRAGFSWPLRGKVISSYGPKAGGLYNEGINIAAPRGTPVASAADGTVVYVGDGLESYGNLVLIRHAGGMVSAYAHLGSVIVSKGDRVRQGQPIGAVGSTGAVTNAQLHFEIREGAETRDPLLFL